MITYSEYFDDYVEDLNRYLHKIKHSIYNITNKEDYNKTREYIFEAEKCTDETRQEQNRVKRMLLSIYQNKLVFKGLLILIIILLVIANIGVIIYKIR
ncbi:hypothetical protein PFFVO_00512 [Plasmodium falciparum Vietnam Oak-Knoll (FVO)]|uniref:Vesicle transport v-SNARE N-terminal domain-containing protein n=1 Tax=Plasmodium falciparum Vietnam Oak-Knoll (FVO) TaxID=1036723 RepID=A0A024VCR4_PLAFA|nr:hypothetical protein PFFVO_00512 [Plasmodium falciparum Vietnam Oak-Knoll (FVO)]